MSSLVRQCFFSFIIIIILIHGPAMHRTFSSMCDGELEFPRTNQRAVRAHGVNFPHSDVNKPQQHQQTLITWIWFSSTVRLCLPDLSVCTGCFFFLSLNFLQPSTFFIFFSVFEPLKSGKSHELMLESSYLASVLFFILFYFLSFLWFRRCFGCIFFLFCFSDRLVRLKQVW